LLEEVELLRRDVEMQSRDSLQQQEVIMNLNQRLLDREQVIAELEHRILELQQDRLSSRDYENLLRDKRIELDEERRLRQDLEAETRYLQEDLVNLRERTETYAEEGMKESIRQGAESARHSEYKSTAGSPRHEGVWKEKAALLATKFYAALRTLRGELQEVKFEASKNMKAMRTEFELTVEELTAKYRTVRQSLGRKTSRVKRGPRNK
jgi:hypothetical protein